MISYNIFYFSRYALFNKEGKKTNEIIPSGLKKRLVIYQDTLEGFENKQKSLAQELSKEGGFLSEIQEVQVKLSGIDEELGLSKEVA